MDEKDLLNENYVAHYTKLKTLLSDILPKKQLKLSMAESVNDPFENTTDWIDDDPSTELTIQTLFHKDTIESYLGKYIKLFSTTLFDTESLTKEGIENLYYGIPILWSHYGDRHNGVCLILDKREISQNIKNSLEGKLFQDKIFYRAYHGLEDYGVSVDRQELPSLVDSPDLLFQLINKNGYIKKKYFEKTNCWSVENEYRWLVLNKNIEDTFFPIGNALKAIIIGAGIKKEKFISVFEKIKNARTSSNVKFAIFALECRTGKYYIDSFGIE
ncbi:DUF2971 domain-containing protein [Fluoribacter dumoffii]|uniref:DUF2971 domain-containing protein n=1 Tax=Fluoribacter dumoffii TaxID=463 RepID=UPI002243E214|nr:DUF2971 domain-containing protein [Fluoribacter dumoffii]MCW8416909.1 DUF2971 domain-containing protein [Fluoribacter dumoffii]MCW8455251.1 DUF2971 domain-containing protein [Fluoribacter dumoffii]MCW8460672.1 DUF2971 domain-containing protein [Fluoribacter dumoffii]MCW8484152.1 DUF2971 domain-containing protein [Fluoribacter dumoffii]